MYTLAMFAHQDSVRGWPCRCSDIEFEAYACVVVVNEVVHTVGGDAHAHGEVVYRIGEDAGVFVVGGQHAQRFGDGVGGQGGESG